MRTFTRCETFPDPDFPLVVKGDPMHYHRVPMHDHEFHEVVVVSQGSGLYRFGDTELPAAQGDVFVISPGELHELLTDNEMKLAVFMFERQPLLDAAFSSLAAFVALFDIQPLLRPGPAHQRHLRLGPEQLAEVLVLHDQLDADLMEQGAAYRQLAQARFQQVIALCCRAYEQQRPADSLVPRLATVISYINGHLTEPIRLAELAAQASCSVNQLGRLFKLAYQCTPGEYMMQRRLQLACEQLRNSQHSITAIALDCGFSDGNYFSKQFKKAFGISPRQWRREA